MAPGGKGRDREQEEKRFTFETSFYGLISTGGHLL